MAESAEPSVDQLTLLEMVRKAQAGCDESAQHLFDRCRQPLLTIIRRVMTPPMRRLFDSDDFLLSTFEEIFTRHFSDALLRSPASLWPYLKRIAENKVRDAQRKYLLSQRYSILREVPLADLAIDSPDMSPDEIFMLKELVEERLANLIGKLPALLQTIVHRLLAGEVGLQVANSLRLEPKRVYRAMEWLKRQIIES